MLMYTPSHHIIFLKGYLSADITVQCMVFLLIAFPSKKMLVLVKVNHLKIEKKRNMRFCFCYVQCDADWLSLSGTIHPSVLFLAVRQAVKVSQSVSHIHILPRLLCFFVYFLSLCFCSHHLHHHLEKMIVVESVMRMKRWDGANDK